MLAAEVRVLPVLAQVLAVALPVALADEPDIVAAFGQLRAAPSVLIYPVVPASFLALVPRSHPQVPMVAHSAASHYSRSGAANWSSWRHAPALAQTSDWNSPAAERAWQIHLRMTVEIQLPSAWTNLQKWDALEGDGLWSDFSAAELD